MMSESCRIVSNSNDLVVLDFSSSTSHFEKIYSFDPNKNNKSVFVGSSWAMDGSCVASTVKNSQKIVMTYSKHNVFTSVETMTIGNPIQVSFLKHTLSKLVVGSPSTVNVYDIKKKKSLKEFKLKSNLKNLSVNFDDHFIAAGCKNGSVYLLNNVTNSVSNPMTPTSDTSEISALEYGHRATLAAGHNNGNIVFWDCNRNARIKTYTDHLAPCTAISFSGINESLVLSSGLDKRCIFYDIQTRKMLNSIKAESPLTSAQILNNGVQVALGTTTGHILIYDLRSFVKPLADIKAHNSSVNCIALQSSKNEGLFGPATRSKLKPQQTAKFEQNEVVMKENVPNVEQEDHHQEFSTTMERARDSIGSQVISPLRGSEFHTSSATSPALSDSTFKDISRTSLGISPNPKNISTDSLFSPLKEQSTNSPVNNSGLTLPKTPITSFNRSISTPLVSPLTMIREEDLNLLEEAGMNVDEDEDNSSQMPRLQLPKMSQPNQHQTKAHILDDEHGIKEDAVDGGATKMENNPSKTLGTLMETFKASHVGANSTPLENPKASANIKHIMNAFPQVLMMGVEDQPDSQSISSKLEERVQTDKNQNLTVFQLENLRSCVEDAMDDFCTDLRQQNWHLQYDMIRSFQNQKQEFDEMLKQYVINDQLRQENERLRKEIEELKKYF